MDKTKAVVRKSGNKFCIFSKTGKKLGCYPSREQAEKRLKQIEYFKHVKGQDNMGDFLPELFGEDKSRNSAKRVDVEGNGAKLTAGVGTVAGKSNPKILDAREHFPIETEGQAKSAFQRVERMSAVPAWFNGSVSELKHMVVAAISAKYPNIQVKREVDLDQALANVIIKATAAETKVGVIKNPEDKVETEVPGVPRPKLKASNADEFAASFASEDVDYQKSVGKTLTELMKENEQRLAEAMKMAKKLESKGLTADEFKMLYTYLQQDILSCLMACLCKSSASNDKSDDNVPETDADKHAKLIRHLASKKRAK